MGIIIKRPHRERHLGRRSGPDPARRSRFDDINARVAAMMNRRPRAGRSGRPDFCWRLGFTFAHPQVDTAIVGTTNPDHLLSNIEMVNSGLDLAGGVVEELYRRFDVLGARLATDYPEGLQIPVVPAEAGDTRWRTFA